MSYLLKPGTSQNYSKPAKTSRNQPKRPKKYCKTTRNDLKFQNSGSLKFFSSFCFSNIEEKIAKFEYFGPKSINFLNLDEILLAPYFQSADLKSDICFRKFRSKMPKFGIFGPKSINFLS